MQIGRAIIHFEIFPLYPWRAMHGRRRRQKIFVVVTL